MLNWKRPDPKSNKGKAGLLAGVRAPSLGLPGQWAKLSQPPLGLGEPMLPRSRSTSRFATLVSVGGAAAPEIWLTAGHLAHGAELRGSSNPPQFSRAASLMSRSGIVAVQSASHSGWSVGQSGGPGVSYLVMDLRQAGHDQQFLHGKGNGRIAGYLRASERRRGVGFGRGDRLAPWGAGNYHYVYLALADPATLVPGAGRNSREEDAGGTVFDPLRPEQRRSSCNLGARLWVSWETSP